MFRSEIDTILKRERIYLERLRTALNYFLTRGQAEISHTIKQLSDEELAAIIDFNILPDPVRNGVAVAITARTQKKEIKQHLEEITDGTKPIYIPVSDSPTPEESA